MANLKPIVPSEMNPPLVPVRVTDIEGLRQVEDFINRVNHYTIDVETNLEETLHLRKIRTIQVGDKNEQYVIDLLAFAGSKEALIFSQGNYGSAADLCFGSVISALRPSLETNKWLKVGVNLQFDYEMLFWNLGIRMWHLYDCFLAEKVLYSGEVHFMQSGFWAMEDVVARYCGLQLTDTTTGHSFDLETPLTDEQVTYCGLDCRLPLAVRIGQLRRLEAENLMVTAQIEFDAVPAFGDMRVFGFKLSTDAWLELYNKTVANQRLIVAAMDAKFIPTVGEKYVTQADTDEMERLEQAWRGTPNKTPEQKAERQRARIEYMTKRKSVNERLKKADECEGIACINYGSNKQLKEALWKMGFKKTQLKDTNDKTLESLAEVKKREWGIEDALKEDETLMKFGVIDLLRLYRSTYKALTTYGLAWVKPIDVEFVDPTSGKKKWGFINPVTGRIHSNIIQLGAATGRTSSSDPNVQNIPRGSEYRFAFVADEGWKLVTVDMSGAELRILAEMSGEPVWVEAFRKGWDVHSVGAQIVFGDEWDNGTEPGCKFAEKKEKCKCKVHKELRQIAKTINFMLAYGGGPQKLADEVGITFERADEIINKKYKPAFPTVTKFLEKLGEAAATYLAAYTMVGRRRKWNKPSWEDAKERAAADAKKAGKPLTTELIRKKYKGMFAAIKREGMNCPIQGTNADFIKRAMGCGFDPSGKPYLWHTLWPKYKAKMVQMVHDELVSEAPDAVADEVKAVVGDAMTRASAEWMKSVVMETEGSVDQKWSK